MKLLTNLLISSFIAVFSLQASAGEEDFEAIESLLNSSDHILAITLESQQNALLADGYQADHPMFAYSEILEQSPTAVTRRFSISFQKDTQINSGGIWGKRERVSIQITCTNDASADPVKRSCQLPKKIETNYSSVLIGGGGGSSSGGGINH